MSVVVRMEMPKCCEDCAAEYDCMACGITGTLWYEESEEFNPSNGRLPDCPIICSLPEGHGRLVDAEAYSAEMKERQEAAWKWRNEAIAEEDELKLARAEGAFTAFTEAKLTMDKHIISPWHRVEDGLPPKATWVLTVATDGNVKLFNIATVDAGGQWWTCSPQNILRELYGIRYWMPIEPPKEDA